MDTRTVEELTRRLNEIENLIALYQRTGDPDARYDLRRLEKERNEVQALLGGRR